MMRIGLGLGFALLVFACARRADPLDLQKAGAEVEAQIVTRAGIELRGDHGRTALGLAVSRGDAPIVRVLLASGASVHVRDDEDMTPLHVAAAGPARDVASALLAGGADIHARAGVLGLEPIHMAARFGTPEMLELLLERGADASARDGWGRTPLHWLADATVCGCSAPVLPDRSGSTYALPHDGCSRIEIAARALVQAGAEVSAKDDRGLSPLHAAAQTDCVPLVHLYIERAPEALSERTATERNALDLAIDHHAVLVSNALFGAGLAPKDGAALPPLLQAARYDDASLAERVLAFGLRPAERYGAMSAVDEARRAGSHDVLALLEAHGYR